MERCPFCGHSKRSFPDRFGPKLECSTEFQERPAETPGGKPGGVFVLRFRLRVPILRESQATKENSPG